MENMTAKVSCFARAYHYRNKKNWIFKDDKAGDILGEKEYQMIAEHMTQGIQFFQPDFNGTKEEALRVIVDQQLSPSVLARSAFCERHLENEMKLGCRQYLILAAGYDTYALRVKQPELTVYHLDLEEMIADRKQRMEMKQLKYQTKAYDISCDLSKEQIKDKLLLYGYRQEQKTYVSLLGINYYLTKDEFRRLLEQLTSIMPEGSAICMDYPQVEDGEESRKNRELAKAAEEGMKAKYEKQEIEEILNKHGFLVYEHLDDQEMTKQYFELYNKKNINCEMKASKGVGYLLAVKKKR